MMVTILPALHRGEGVARGVEGAGVDSLGGPEGEGEGEEGEVGGGGSCVGME